ncbi:hypothetical protein E2C01_083236 [Portunus trituberculatus]|uniref:Uncharacterized protein n=1 Tax=Portunus trituberculatus TaxID=210409 RepID=A0A5B7J0M9_PORTR|nr:hypothetical protein [Portunus trituberculatus]
MKQRGMAPSLSHDAPPAPRHCCTPAPQSPLIASPRTATPPARRAPPRPAHHLRHVPPILYACLRSAALTPTSQGTSPRHPRGLCEPGCGLRVATGDCWGPAGCHCVCAGRGAGGARAAASRPPWDFLP